MASVQTEQILVVPTQLFHDCGYFQGFSSEVEKYLPTLLDPANTSYRPRDLMEEDPSFKQLIPYCIFEFEDESGVQIFQYTRGKGQGEARLHNKKSVGIGGHISTLDTETDTVYENGLARELEEEVEIETEYSNTCVGLINDDSNEVGKVHLGVVHRMKVVSPNVRSKEIELEYSGFERIESVLESLDRYESWSQIAIRALYG